MSEVEYRDQVENCPQHPRGEVVRVWQEKRYVLNGIESHVISRTIVGYECAECGKELLEKVSLPLRAEEEK